MTGLRCEMLVASIRVVFGDQMSDRLATHWLAAAVKVNGVALFRFRIYRRGNGGWSADTGEARHRRTKLVSTRTEKRCGHVRARDNESERIDRSSAEVHVGASPGGVRIVPGLDQKVAADRAEF